MKKLLAITSFLFAFMANAQTEKQFLKEVNDILARVQGDTIFSEGQGNYAVIAKNQVTANKHFVNFKSVSQGAEAQLVGQVFDSLDWKNNYIINWSEVSSAKPTDIVCLDVKFPCVYLSQTRNNSPEGEAHVSKIQLFFKKEDTNKLEKLLTNYSVYNPQLTVTPEIQSVIEKTDEAQITIGKWYKTSDAEKFMIYIKQFAYTEKGLEALYKELYKLIALNKLNNNMQATINYNTIFFKIEKNNWKDLHALISGTSEHAVDMSWAKSFYSYVEIVAQKDKYLIRLMVSK